MAYKKCESSSFALIAFALIMMATTSFSQPIINNPSPLPLPLPPIRLPSLPPVSLPPVSLSPPVAIPPISLSPPVSPSVRVTILGTLTCNILPLPIIFPPIGPTTLTLSCDGGRTTLAQTVTTGNNGRFTFTLTGNTARLFNPRSCAIFSSTRGSGCRSLNAGEVYRAPILGLTTVFLVGTFRVARTNA